MELVEAEIVLLSEAEGGRISPLSREAFGGTYRPHIVVGNPNQREAIVEATEDHPRTLTEKYQGVAFMRGPDLAYLPINECIRIELALMYYPNNEYSDVVKNTTFTLREASTIVGYGKIIRRWNEENT